MSNKHGIPLNIQPRRTRWDNGEYFASNIGSINARILLTRLNQNPSCYILQTDLNRPKDEAERHKRTLESKRRWAAKNRAEKRAKRKGTTVEEELGLIEAAEAAEAAAAAAGRNHNSNNTTTNAGGSVYGDEDNAGGDESFTSQDGQSTSGPMLSVTQPQGQPLHQSQHQHHQGYWQDGRPIQQQLPAQPSQTSEHPYPTSLSSQFQYAHPRHAVEELQMEATPVQHVRYASHPPPQLQYAQQQQVTYLEGNAGHQPYTIVYPTYTLSPDPNTSARFQRSPSQPDFPTHLHQGAQYNAAVSPVDGSFQHQQGQYMQTVYQQVPVQHPTQGPSTATASLLQTTPLAQQPFLAPPSAASSNAQSLQRSLSAPIPTSGPIVYNRHNPPRLHQLPPAPSQGVSTSGAPVAYGQYHPQPAHYAMQTSDEQRQQQQQQIAQAPDAAAAASIARPTSSNSGVTIYIPPPPPPSTQTWGNDNAEQATPLAHPIPIYVQGQQQGQGQLQDGQSQMPPTPYFYLSVPPESTPIAEQQTPVSYAVRPIPTSIQDTATDAPPQASAREVLPVVNYAVPQAQVQQKVSDAAAYEQALPVHRTVGDKTKSVQVPVAASKSSKKKPSTGEHQNSTTAKKTQKQTVSANVAHSTKTYQEAAMQLLALKTASSSPPASPVKDYFASAAGGGNGADEDDNEDDDKDRGSMQEELDAEMWRSTDAEGSFAEVEDSGYAPYHDDHDDFMRHSKGPGSQQSNSTHKDGVRQSIDQEEEDDEDEQSTRQAHLRFASIPPSSPAPVRMSLSPESSPMPMSMPTVPSKLSATYLRAQQASSAAGNKRFTPIALQKKRKLTAGAAIGTENDENARHDVDGSSDVERDENDGDDDDDDEDGERISLDSSPVQEDEDMKAPLAKRRLISMSSASPRSRIRHGGGQHVITSTSGISDSRSPSPSRYTSAHSSSFATSVLMSTPHLGGGGDDIHGPRQQHSQAGNGLFFAETGGHQRKDEGGNIFSRRGYSHHHRSSIFKIDNCSRPSAGLSGMAGAASSSSPSRPFLLSSPEHAAVSKSLGLVPDNFTASNNNTSSFALPPSDSEVGFEMNSFLRGFNSIHSGDNGFGSKNWKRGQKQYGLNTDNGVGLSEYAKDVFGGPI